MATAQLSTRVGVLALQGSFREHMTLLNAIPNVEVIEVRTKEELESVSGLIIPGGESTTMAHIAERWGLIPELRSFAKLGKPIWGTCAGMIFLAENAEGQKQGGQALLGGLNILVSRNFFGAQINSFETQLDAPECIKQYGGPSDFRALFIRAPAVLDTSEGVEPLAYYHLTQEERRLQGRESVIVAVRSGVLLATAFHPELTTDTRWHQLFVDMVRQHARQTQERNAATPKLSCPGRIPNRPLDMPVYAKEFMKTEPLPAHST
ncbi:hypothetical protein CEUSTIGMA_g4895.t1 [Chlamydomonas eustigma]|uniref:glutaminase n=1 Tax=Chlamydomonas eustigma TaxID=1157962 RepID=A0A250X312_9CHLO|nr:hypothetical protein CEUSTIGMA_g4895.t1 [Chlamydomonas eustigma]|eukprot:GAX77451.1 hypothetical protein CEUSTIGMA_g4895.t1 [Chlamydomonas eustigma]